MKAPAPELMQVKNSPPRRGDHLRHLLPLPATGLRDAHDFTRTSFNSTGAPAHGPRLLYEEAIGYTPPIERLLHEHCAPQSPQVRFAGLSQIRGRHGEVFAKSFCCRDELADAFT